MSTGLSKNLEELFAGNEADLTFDFIIVGSGYGGATAAAELSGRGKSICILERGREFLPGDFPSRWADVTGEVRFSTPAAKAPRGQRDGLFDARVSNDVTVLVASGLGGGSLINAGVMARSKLPDFGDGSALQCYLLEAERLLGARNNDGTNTIQLSARKDKWIKSRALQSLARDGEFVYSPITIAMQDGANRAGVRLNACIGCGDCATGCNHNAKISLDTSLLAEAWRRGAKIFCGATVLRLDRVGSLWEMQVVHTDAALRKRQRQPLRLKGENVILAAGALGSTEILMRSQNERLRFSPRLGQKFSANGDMIVTLYDGKDPVNAFADPGKAPEERNVGPTNTGWVDLRNGDAGGVVIEDLSVPAPLRRMLEETLITAATLNTLTKRDPHPHAKTDADPCAVDPKAIVNSQILALMVDDRAEGCIELPSTFADRLDAEGLATVRWPELKNLEVFDQQVDPPLRKRGKARKTPTLPQRVADSKSGARVLPYPLWRPVPKDLEDLTGRQRGPVVTVHPLGGCTIGSTVSGGVVDENGRVFNGDLRPGFAQLHEGRHKGLYVLDGSIVPSALGINPALTIAALALRGARKIAESLPKQTVGQLPTPPPRNAKRAPIPPPNGRTEVEIFERLIGDVDLTIGGRLTECKVELSLSFESVAINELIKREPKSLTVEPERSTLRIYDREAWQEMKPWQRDTTDQADERKRDKAAIVVARVEKTLSFLHRDETTVRQRSKTLWPWLFNRGVRDTLQSLWRRDLFKKNLCAFRRNLCAQLSLAGEVRLFDYDLAVERIVKGADKAPWLEAGSPIHAHKRFTYGRRSNPLRQLSQASLKQLGTRCWPASGTQPVLCLDLNTMVGRGIPLLRLSEQTDQPTTLSDLTALGLYILRLVLRIHLLSARKPDAPLARAPQRLPGVIAGAPAPEYHLLDVGTDSEGREVKIRLTRYPRDGAPPVLMIHAYSASGTVFTHPSLKRSLASYLSSEQFDVWVLDMRSSTGMPTASQPWRFEDMARADIPAAVEFIWRKCNERREGDDGRKGNEMKVHVVAHCMGAAMFSMALLDNLPGGVRWHQARQALPTRIASAVLSQIGPSLAMHPSNLLRAYAMQYLRYYLPMTDFDFRTEPTASLVDQLLNRLLAMLPYRPSEYEVENPSVFTGRLFNTFVGTRHRVDALYGQSFEAANLRRATLESIDDLFGRVSLDTVAQTIPFARLMKITTREGRDDYVSARRFKERFTFPVFSIHGELNGLADPATLEEMKQLVADAHSVKAETDEELDEKLAPYLQTKPCEGYGHTDVLIGAHAHEDIFPDIAVFLRSAPDRYKAAVEARDAAARRALVSANRETPQPPPRYSVHAATRWRLSELPLEGRQTILVIPEGGYGPCVAVACVWVKLNGDAQAEHNGVYAVWTDPLRSNGPVFIVAPERPQEDGFQLAVLQIHDPTTRTAGPNFVPQMLELG